jgi:hypothetical protein
VIPGETVATGAPTTCSECNKELKIQVCMSAAGYYIGYFCDQDGPWSRESGYYTKREEAEAALKAGGFERT